MKRATALRRELPAAFRIPYRVQLSPHVVRTEAGDYVQVFRLDGASFETADDEVLNNWHERLNVLWRNIAAPNVALWMHVIRRRERVGAVKTDDMAAADFAEQLATRYQARLSTETLMVNELYLSVAYRPIAGAAPNLVARLLSAKAGEHRLAEHADALDACEKLAQTVGSSLARYDPERLGVYESGGRLYSRVLEFFGQLVNADLSLVPLPTAPLDEVLATTRITFGSETIEYRLPTQTRFGAMLGIKEYASPTTVGMYNVLLSAPFEFVLTQSFAFLTKAAGQGLLQRQYNQMANAGDFAVSQAEQLKDALDDLTSNDFVMGDHHFTLQVLSPLVDRQTGNSNEQRLRLLNDEVALARAVLADTGMTTAREDLALEAAFWAQLPACFPMRPRKAPITSRNFCAMAPLHNFPAGRPTGNHWGDALALLVTSARSPYHFSLHASDPHDPDGGSRKDTGHTFICGPTGSGKSVLIGFLVTLLARQGVTQVIFDKDRGLDILTRALGGTYLPLRNGVPTGFNPLQLPPTAETIEFLKVWLRALVRGTIPLTIREEGDLDAALMGTLALDASARRLSRLIEFTDATRSEGIHMRLARWCESTQGHYARVFDNAEDSLVGKLAKASLFGVDVTEFLDNALTRAPVTLYLFHVIRQLLDGRKFVCWMDEFWKLLSDPSFEGFAKDGPKTWRKLNGVMCLATQSASDVLDSPISRTIIEQTPTKILFPNPDANAAEYIEGFGLSEREFKLIKEQIEPGSRQFLIKQGHYSVVCQLDLKGFDAELKVISGRASTVEELQRLIARTGPDPRQWLPSFLTPEKSS
ncbi:Type IV secretion system protein virB4 [Gammaproteobacteria bacterium]|nr:VirB4 family type IV secretion/conjugal transfer ATPase [Hyphomicrobiales bacterium]CAG0938751.1 Type IV secretion system protein virB4 [Gammaproteobacteria bacterium]